ncbi:MAG: ABC transporter permease [Clostridiales bacterium]|nr:ABC transporter permease [Clostridiales bacterium]
MKNKTKLPNIYLGIITFIMYVPIILTVVYSFNTSRITSIWGGFTLDWYKVLFQDHDIGIALRNSLILAVISCFLAAVIGTLGAYGMAKIKTKPNQIIGYLSILPIMIPEIILGMVFLAVFSFIGLPFGLTTLIIAHTTFCIPYVLLNVKARLVGMNRSLEEAALDLGASKIRTFFDITLPLISPAIWSGVLLSFAMSFDDVVISIFVTGPQVNTLPIKIYTKMKTGVTPEINALATVMLLATIILIFASYQVGKVGNHKKISKGE